MGPSQPLLPKLGAFYTEPNHPRPHAMPIDSDTSEVNKPVGNNIISLWKSESGRIDLVVKRPDDWPLMGLEKSVYNKLSELYDYILEEKQESYWGDDDDRRRWARYMAENLQEDAWDWFAHSESWNLVDHEEARRDAVKQIVEIYPHFSTQKS